MSSPLEVIEGFVEVFLLDLDLSYFVQGATLKELILRASSDDLFKVQDSVVAVVKFL